MVNRAAQVTCCFILASVGALLSSGACLAQDSDTLKKIRDSGSITLAVREASSPFSFVDDQQQYVGYSIDLCLKIVDAMRAELKMPKLRVDMTAVTPQTRIPLMANGTVDLECGSTTNTLQRQKQVGFVVTTFVTGTKLLVKKSSNIKNYRDLKGKPVVVTSGTADGRVMQELDARENLGLGFILAKEHTESFLNLETGRAAAFPSDEILLRGLKANASNPAEYEVVGDFLSDAPLAIMLRKDDAAFKKIADQAILALINSGEIEQIYRKWFESPIPPHGVNLKVPMSEALRELFKAPNDKGAGACNRMKC
jgi:glutamate/aspartate transport system substrate-binding protein